MEEFIAQNLEIYGPIAVFVLLMLSGVGVSLNEDLVNISAGILVGGGELLFWPTLAAAYLGVVCSDCLWFSICSRYGTPLLHKRWMKRLIHPRRLLEAKHELERRGAWMIVIARFIPGSRTTAVTVAGMLHMPFWRFAAVTAACVCLTAPLQIGAGVLIAQGTGSYELAEQLQVMFGAIMVFVALSLTIGWVRRRMARKGFQPRAKMRWLKRFRARRARRCRAKQSGQTIRNVQTGANNT